ncbi:4-hydroxythreonine-4-phosphate dehydrogenase PdxA [Amycolatopsis granulosa]|uniref:4-hydroxythreonine-4-phosphate dehydrogenase PdxA n=1 Tax=Amycolatopsis granulosa TaxID=185684 RepID=UPI0014238346|nr:4-hydroxythreonine-4-phosphate dehydrogenase PdxA [Amycolatopsis granulosa]NIH86014.1 4-hydroxythreonine-4-phosphate dehydrogenase [Amycolatopsis granulosa]
MKPIAITMGDPAGIGAEIVLKLAAEVRDRVPLVVLGDAGVLTRTRDQLKLDITLQEVSSPADAADAPGVLPVITTSAVGADLPVGVAGAEAGQAAYDAVAAAIGYAMDGQIDAIVTAPLNKESLRLAGLPYPGHTEILAELSGTDDYTMMMASEDLRVVLVTIHEPLKDAIARIDEDSILRVIRLADAALRPSLGARPRIGVAGLNPHAGENGVLGTEEIDTIRPAVDRARAEGFDVSGPFPPDTVFLRARTGGFDVVVAQYHDQGLIPFKYLGLEKGVNVTIGLPFVRTSVDHGTAFDIVGKGIADHRSLRVALDQALLMVGQPALAKS